MPPWSECIAGSGLTDPGEPEEGPGAQLIQHNTPTSGLAEGLCDMTVVRSAHDLGTGAHQVIGHEVYLVTVAADDPWVRRRFIRLEEIPGRTLALDRRTGTTTLDLWTNQDHPAVDYTGDIDDWLTTIAAGNCIGLTPASTATQHQRASVVYHPLRDVDPVPDYLIWRAEALHPATHSAVALASSLYRAAATGKGGETRGS